MLQPEDCLSASITLLDSLAQTMMAPHIYCLHHKATTRGPALTGNVIELSLTHSQRPLLDELSQVGLLKLVCLRVQQLSCHAAWLDL